MFKSQILSKQTEVVKPQSFLRVKPISLQLFFSKLVEIVKPQIFTKYILPFLKFSKSMEIVKAPIFTNAAPPSPKSPQ